GNPTWQVDELSQVAQLLTPDCLWASSARETRWLSTGQSLQGCSSGTQLNSLNVHSFNQPLMYFPTGGSSGQIRFVAHSQSTLTAAVQGLQQFLSPLLSPSKQINSFCLLPLFHVGGFMQWWRSALTNGQFCVMDYAMVKQAPPLTLDNFVTSLVPTQLNVLLHHHPQFLKQFSLIFLGGAPAWSELLSQARELKINLAPTYGMTETAGQIATLTPTEFLQGHVGVGRILPHVSVALNPADCASFNQSLKYDGTGLLSIKSDALCLGYYPHLDPLEWWQTDDLGSWQNGYLTIVGRQNRQIISGGENIDPLEIENCLLDHHLVEDIVIVGVGDRHWGEVVTAIFVSRPSLTLEQVIQTLKTYLAPHKCPKYWLPVPAIRRSPLGKINYAELQAWAEQQISHQG
ncbi:MAG: O-succinylbenzoic acid--CoA ligase, partial [Cyanobacteriota bacterium]